jgi:hypothetical protein
MAQSRGHTPFSLYYWGQDRFGAWPFLLESAWTAVTGWQWTPDRAFVVLVAWAMLGCVVWTAFHQLAGIIAALTSGVVLLLREPVRQSVLHLGQPYAWQWTLLVISWLLIRRAFKAQTEWLIVAALFLCALLACWTSPVSGPLLVLLFLVEALRSFSRARVNWSPASAKRPVVILVVLLAAFGAEWFGIRGYYHYFSILHYGWDHGTLIRGEPQRFWANLAQLLPSILRGGFSFVPLAAALAPILLIASLWRSRRSPPESHASAAADAWFLATGATLVAACNLGIAALVSHVRRNDYSERYLSLTHLFFSIAAALVLFGLVLQVLRSRKGQVAATVAFTAVAIGLLLIKLPGGTRDLNYVAVVDLAKNLRDGPKGRVLLGAYWDVYPLAALAQGTVIPLEPDFELAPRTPFNKSALHDGTEVIVIHGNAKLGKPEAPPPTVEQFGARLELVQSRSWTGAGLVLSRYKVNGRAEQTAAGPIPAKD